MNQKLIINSEEQELMHDSADLNKLKTPEDRNGLNQSEKSIPVSDNQSPIMMMKLELPTKQIKSTSNISVSLSSNVNRFVYPEDQASKVRTISSDIPQQPNITPGYKKYQMDEQNAQFDHIKGLFTEEEIREAFNVLDLNKDGGITSEDLTFFLDFIGEKPTQEEIEEMIRMCDTDGSGEVRYDEFRKMAAGMSLTPLGQAYAPTKELVEKRTLLNQMMMEKEIQEVAKKGQITAAMVEDIKKTELMSPRYMENEQQQSMFQSIDNIAAQTGRNKKISRQVPGQNLKATRSEEGQISQSTKQKSQLSQKEIMLQRKLNAQRYVKEKKIEQPQQLQEIFDKINKLDLMEKCSYEDFVNYLDLNEGPQSKLLFNAMTECPVREEYVKAAEDAIQEQSVNFKFAILSFLGAINCRKHDKLELAYTIIDSNQNGYITLDNLIQLLVYLYCIADISIIEQKTLKMMAKKGLLDRKDIIQKELYINLINEYGQVFEPI